MNHLLLQSATETASASFVDVANSDVYFLFFSSLATSIGALLALSFSAIVLLSRIENIKWNKTHRIFFILCTFLFIYSLLSLLNPFRWLRLHLIILAVLLLFPLAYYMWETFKALHHATQTGSVGTRKGG